MEDFAEFALCAIMFTSIIISLIFGIGFLIDSGYGKYFISFILGFGIASLAWASAIVINNR